MEERSLARSFGDSLSEEVSGLVGEYAELGLDALIDDGLFKDVPILSTVMAVYRIGKSIRERHHIAKLISFVNEINSGIASAEKRQSYQEKFASNEKFRNQEIEYILILIDRYVGFDKPQMLAKLYQAYLDGRIVWKEFTMYAEVVDRFLPGDWDLLDEHQLSLFTPESIDIDGVQRLISMGLVTEAMRKVKLFSGTGDKISTIDMEGYVLTRFGGKLRDILL